MTTNLRKSLTALTLALSVASISAQTTTFLLPDRDGTLYESPTGSLANGAGLGLFCGLNNQNGVRRMMLHFPMSQIPANAVVLAATLTLEVVSSGSPAPLNVDVHSVSMNWGEGASVAPGTGGMGGPAALDDATWLHNYSASQFWTTPGGDFAAQPSFSFDLPDAGGVTTLPLPNLIADVQSWVDSPATNYGWILKSDEQVLGTVRRILSRENPTLQPTLAVTWITPGETGNYGTGCPVGPFFYDVTFQGSPTGGTTIPIEHTNSPANSIGVNLFSLGLDAIGTPLFPGCTLYLPLNQPIINGAAFTTDFSGFGTTPFTLPAGFPGYLIVCQGAVIDSTPIRVSLGRPALLVLQ